MEGEQKLQGEKPLNTEERIRQNTRLPTESNVYADGKDQDSTADHHLQAIDRVGRIVSINRTFLALFQHLSPLITYRQSLIMEFFPSTTQS